METPHTVSVLVAAEPLLLASALADMLELRGIRVFLFDPEASESHERHTCLSLVDGVASLAAHGIATVWIPAELDAGTVQVEVHGRRRLVPIRRATELAAVVAEVARELACCRTVPFATT